MGAGFVVSTGIVIVRRAGAAKSVGCTALLCRPVTTGLRGCELG